MNNRRRTIDKVWKLLFSRNYLIEDGEIAGWKWERYWVPHRRIGIRIW